MRRLFFILLCRFVFICWLPSSFAQEMSAQTQLIKQIEQLITVNSETLNDEEVNILASNILTNRQHYPNEAIAKLFLLLANSGINKGDINTALQYIQQGIAIPTANKTIKLCLQLKLAELLIAKKDYAKLLDVAQQAVLKSEQVNQVKYKLFALSYRSVALATLGHHQQALLDLQQVEQGIIENKLFNKHIELFTILAAAYYQLSDYQTVLTLQLKILKLRFELEQKGNIEHTYLALGYAYLYLRRFDDAYNAFWEAKHYGERKNAPLTIAYANKGLGISLLKQEQYNAAAIVLQDAADVFQRESLHTNLIETFIALAKVKLNRQDKKQGYALLVKTLTLLDDKPLSLEFIGFYRMLAAMYFDLGNYQEAYLWQKKHSQLLAIKVENKKKAVKSAHHFYNQPLHVSQEDQSIVQSRELAIKLTKENESSSDALFKFQRQEFIIISLLVFILFLLLTLLALIFKLRAKKRALVYETGEKPSYMLASPMQTKHDYQLTFKKARAYQYPLTVGYFVIENWQELTFLCNKKNLKEVRRGIASVINKQLTEFDQVGLLNDGEYLLMFEHQGESEIKEKIESLAQALRVRFFAHLGDFSVTTNYGLKSPSFKDIDPYIFLARLCETVDSSKPISK
jgi:tetratricopeptide (TPR) repeat protein